MILRPERANDIDAIHALTTAAFKPMSYSDGTEADCIDKLRADGDLHLSLVATQDDEIIGHIAFSPVTLDGISDNWFGLGPISVAIPHQKTGIGSALIRAGFDWLHTQNAKGCVLIGDPNYYSRFGFISTGTLSYQNLPPELVQWIGWSGNTASGVVRFSRGLEPA
jgi:putative acetyltransferase